MKPSSSVSTQGIPTTMRDFQIIRKLGEGAYSQVYRVKRMSDGQEYALKKVKMVKLSAKEKENALNEVRILASIRHPNIIAYKEAFFEESSQSLCIIMEYANGGDVYEKIVDHTKRASFFKERDVWKYFIQMVRGLKTLHDLKILHRDLKSANMFLTKDGMVKLGDLNVSKVAKKGLLYTQTGTPYYASPQVWKDQPYDWRSDIWSLGCVLYEMVALKPPFRADGMQGLYRKVLKGYYPKIPSHFSSDLGAMIASLLKVSPSMRPSCTQLLNLPCMKERISMEKGDFDPSPEDLTPNGGLLNTIKVPRNLTILTYCLPEANYENEEPNKLYRNQSDLPQKIQPLTCRGTQERGSSMKGRDLQVIHQNYYLPKSSHSRSESRNKYRDISTGKRHYSNAPSQTPMSRVGSQIVSSSEVNLKLSKANAESRERSHEGRRHKQSNNSSLAGVYRYITPNQYRRIM